MHSQICSFVNTTSFFILRKFKASCLSLWISKNFLKVSFGYYFRTILKDYKLPKKMSGLSMMLHLMYLGLSIVFYIFCRTFELKSLSLLRKMARSSSPFSSKVRKISMWAFISLVSLLKTTIEYGCSSIFYTSLCLFKTLATLVFLTDFSIFFAILSE